MNCYNHDKTPAIGICAGCRKGLCKSCHQLHDNTIVCSDACRQKISYISEINDRAMRIYQIGPYQNGSKSIPTVSIVYSLLTILMGGITFLLTDASETTTFFMLGFVTFIFLFITLFTWPRYKKRGIDFWVPLTPKSAASNQRIGFSRSFGDHISF